MQYIGVPRVLSTAHFTFFILTPRALQPTSENKRETGDQGTVYNFMGQTGNPRRPSQRLPPPSALSNGLRDRTSFGSPVSSLLMTIHSRANTSSVNLTLNDNSGHAPGRTVSAEGTTGVFATARACRGNPPSSDTDACSRLRQKRASCVGLSCPVTEPRSGSSRDRTRRPRPRPDRRSRCRRARTACTVPGQDRAAG